MQDMKAPRGRSRFWLYGPAILLIVLAAAWSAGWFYVRGKAADMIDAQLARQAARGHVWACSDRAIGGFPFRLEVTCSNLSLRQGRLSVSLGPARAVAQIYDPRHVILETAGPLQMTDGAASLSGTWKEMEASISGIGRDGFERLSVVTKGGAFTADGVPQIGAFAFTAQSTGLHIRPMPGTAPQDHSFDIAFDAQGVSQPGLDAWTSDREPLQIDAAFALSKVPFPPGPTPVMMLENWRQAGGILRIAKLDMRKGARQLTLTGEIKLDGEHKPDAFLQFGQANFSELALRLTSGGDIRAKFLQPLKPLRPSAAKGEVIPLPSVRIVNGEVRVLGIRIPARVQALY